MVLFIFVLFVGFYSVYYFLKINILYMPTMYGSYLEAIYKTLYLIENGKLFIRFG